MSQRLSPTATALYALPALFLTIIALPLYIHVPKFYSDVVGVDVKVVGAILGLARLFDAVTDPAIGALSDRTRSRWGRRRPYIAVAGVPLGISLVLLLAPPASAGAGWLIGSVVLIYLAWTFVAVPYEALGIDITADYDERTSVMGLREGLAIVGILVALGTPPLLGWAFDLDERARWTTFAWIYGPLTMLACWLSVHGVREPAARPRSARKRGAWRVLISNKPFRVLITSFALATIGANLQAALALFFIDHVLDSERGEVLMLLYVVVGLLAAPGWALLARRTEKRTVWMAALGLSAIAQAAMYFLQPGDELVFGLLNGLAGVPLGALMILPSSMQADAVDVSDERLGEGTAGIYVGLWNVARKVPGALAVGVALTSLGFSGYEADVAPDPAVLGTLRALYCLGPALFSLLALVVAWSYPIDRGAHARIRAGIDARE